MKERRRKKIKRCGNCRFFCIVDFGKFDCFIKRMINHYAFFWSAREYVNPGWFGCVFHLWRKK